MIRSVIFEPTCPNCHHIFEHIKGGNDFRVVCPVCKTTLTSVQYPNFDTCYDRNENGEIEFVYNKLDFY